MEANINKKIEEVEQGNLTQKLEPTDAARKKETMWDTHEQLIADLMNYMKEKRSINTQARELVSSISTSAKRLRQLGGHAGQTRQMLVTPASLLLGQTRTLSEYTATSMDSEFEEENSALSDNSKVSRMKRKSRESPPTDTKDLKKKKKDGTKVAQVQSKEKDAPAASSNWEKVKTRKERQLQRSEKSNKNEEKKKKQRVPVTRPNALIVCMKDKQQYSEVLKRVKGHISFEQARECVDKVRRTTMGDMLIILSKDKENESDSLHKAIAELLGNEADVLSKGPQEDLEIKDLDELTTKEEVLEALKLAAGVDCQIPPDAIRSLRKAYGGTQTASVTVAAAVAKKVLGERGKIRIGWVNCRIRRVERLVKCFKCWHCGHLAIKCKSEVDRAKLCTKCGEVGHKAATCEKEARCSLCAEKDQTKNCAHIAGSGKCPVFREALQKMKSKR
ncbi:uncharacterized protein LOC107040166 [Diachasma alloeum]|uniref:uncharacterized protein LOC107040166 n=1 Tax=Diachasma alloeum TaxID=454923 RepID=UPI000738103B|nr:uncharacterized protein LOC107040166 [Diachasma alloeum]